MLSRKAAETTGINSAPEGAANRIASQGQRQTGHLSPPLAEIHNAVQSRLVVGQLAFVNDESGFVLAFEHLRNDLIEGNNFGFDAGSEQLQRQIGCGERARDRNALGLDFCRSERARGNDHGAVALAHAAAAAHQRVLVLHIGIRVKRNRADVVDALARLLVQRLDVAERVGEPQARSTDFVRGQTVKHEGVVGIRAVGHGNFAHLTGGTAARRFGRFGYCCHLLSMNLVLDCGAAPANGNAGG